MELSKEVQLMFCPKCRGEFREGFTVCQRCNENLVNELPPEPKRFVEKSSAPKESFRIEKWLKKGAIIYIILSFYSDIMTIIRSFDLPGPFALPTGRPAMIISIIMGSSHFLVASLLWGAVFYGLGTVIEILRESLTNETP